MPDGGDWVMPYHSRACPSHHFAYPFPHIVAVAVDGAFLASGFVLAEPAMLQPRLGVLQQLRA